jgi:hypothetical protein
MAFAAPDVGEILLLRYMLNNLSPDNARLHLFTNAITPGESDTLSSYTEATTPGYASISLLGPTWTFSTVSGTTTATYPIQTFTMSTSAVIRGYYITNNASSNLIMAESFDSGAINLPTTGGQVQIDPAIGLE